MSNFILAIDQGTTNTKALLISREGQPVFRASTPLALSTPRAGWVEQDAEALWSSVVEVVQRCIAEVGGGAIAGIAISNQRETALAWTRSNGTAISPAMSWQCRRSSDVCSEAAPLASLVRQRSGLSLDPLLSATKWGWLLRQGSDLQEKAERGALCLGTVDSWLVHKLTQGSVHVTDHTNASRTGLLNLKNLAWDDDLLATFNIPRAALPTLCSSSSMIGTVTAIPELKECPIVAVIGDSHAAMVGHGNNTLGAIKATYGTGSSLMTLTRDLPAENDCLARTIAWSREGVAQYALEGNITMSGAAVQWIGEFLGLERPTADAIALAETVDDAGGLYLVPAMVGLGAPHWNSSARGLLTGLGRNSTKAHMARAAVEAIAFQIADVYHAMQDAVHEPLTALQADGGATRNEVLMQFQADVLNAPVQRSSCEELSALGAAWLGGITLGWWTDPAALRQLAGEYKVFHPQRNLSASYADWQRAVRQTLYAGATA